MQLLKSLFCWNGYDNRQRFFVSYASIFILFILMTSLFNESGFFSILTIAIFTTLYSASIKRRLNDSALGKNWLILPVTSFFLIAVLIVLLEHNSSYWLLLVPIALSSILLTYPSNEKRAYILGYNGPIDLTDLDKTSLENRKQRIEPTLLRTDSFSDEPESLNYKEQHKFSAPLTHDEKIKDIGEIIRIRILGNKNTLSAIISVLTLTIAAVFISVSFSEGTKSADIESSGLPPEANTEFKKAPLLHPLEMNDGFTLYLTKYQGVTISWQANDSVEKPFWSQETAVGDKTCQNLTFNNGEKLRTLTVVVERKTTHKANFSPLDSNKIITGLALRGNFSLCGYKFDLKGSQAILSNNRFYADFID